MSVESWTQNDGLGNNHDTQAYELLHRSESCSSALLIVVNEQVVVYLLKIAMGSALILKVSAHPKILLTFTHQ